MHRGFRIRRGVGSSSRRLRSSFAPTSRPPRRLKSSSSSATCCSSEGRYLDSLDAYRNCAESRAARQRPRGPRIGVITSALRVAEFDLARQEAENAASKATRTARTSLTLYGDALWASGLFEEAEAQYRDALAASPDLARGHHGMARRSPRAAASTTR